MPVTAATKPNAPQPLSASSYRDILHSTLLIGGSTAVKVLIGIARTKVMAVLLGPAGVGLMGVYLSIIDLTHSVAGMGINNSGVRQIAESAASGDALRMARTIVVLRRIAVALGIFGGLLLILLARPIAQATFGDDAHATAVAVLSLAVFLRLVSDGQGALIQGMRRIADLARISVLGALSGTLASIPFVYYLGQDGVVPALVAVTALTAATFWWYSHKVHIEPCVLSHVQIRHEATTLLKLGFAFMASGLLITAAAYIVRLFVLRQSGLGAAGLYQAAWTLGGLYTGFILHAMGTDFYPRLVGVITDNGRANQMVNQQAQISLLLAAPGVIATLTFASLVIALFYTAEFSAAIDVLRWICLGMALRVITWPMGYIIVATNRQALFFGVELAWTLANVGLSWWCVQRFGLNGAGIAFFGSYVFHGLVVYAVVRRLTDFRWSRVNARTGLLFIGAIGLVFVGFQLLPPMWAVGMGTLAMLVSSGYALQVLLVLVPPEQLPKPLRQLRRSAAASQSRARRIWIDLDNSPHVPFFRPIVDELRGQGCTVLLTARDAFQVTDLARLNQMPCITVGRHFGKNKVMKALGLLVRTAQLLPLIVRNRPDLAVSHGSRAQIMAARLLGIPAVVIADYEHVTHVNRADVMIVPEVIPSDVAGRFADRVFKYPGIKEDVYAAAFKPDPAIVEELGLEADKIVVTVRPPATEAHYHNPESEALFAAVIELLAQDTRVQVVLLPRNQRQGEQIARQWPEHLANGKMSIPRQAVDGLNLVWHSDLVISGGGTMNREAAALGVPVYSIFRGPIGAVDRYLAEQGRLVMLESIEDVRTRIDLTRRHRVPPAAHAERSALHTIVGQIARVARGE
jgi:PST family polysaccharide transporter